jgi:pilus assembly protein CpaB
MNRNRLLLIGVLALALGALVSYAVYRNLQSHTVADTRAGVDVVVANRDLQVGEKIAENDVRLARIPADSIPPNVFHLMKSAVGRGVILPISKGDFILPTKVAGENAGSGLPSLIPPGMRAVSVRVNEIVAVAGFVLPGTRVDVLLTGNPSNSGEQQTTTVLENVAVIASGQRLEHNSTGDAQTAPVITLLVSPDDAQKLTLASTQGHIQLSLRNPLDTKQEGIDAVRSTSLYKNVPQPTLIAAKPRPKKIVAVTPDVYTIEVIRGNKKEETKF